MAESIAGKKEGLRCQHSDENRPSGVCDRLLMELRDGVLGIAHRTDHGDHFTPLDVLLSQAEQNGWLPKPKMIPKGKDMLRAKNVKREECAIIERLLTRGKELYEQGILELENNGWTCDFEIEGIRVSIQPFSFCWLIEARCSGKEIIGSRQP